VDSQSLYQDLPPAAPVEKASVIEDFVDIFYAPSKVFERRRDGQFGLALFLLFVLMIVLFFATRAAMEPIYDVMIDQQVAALEKSQPNLNDEQRAGMRSMMEKTFMIGPLVAVPIIVLVVGVTLWFVGKLFDSKQTFGQAMMVSTYAQVPRFVLGSLVSALQAFAMGSDTVTSPFAYSIGAARFAPEASLMTQSLLNRFEVFTIWATILLGIGLHVTGRVPKRQAFIAAAIVFVLGTLMTFLQTMRAG
jgi:hypothetical protein